MCGPSRRSVTIFRAAPTIFPVFLCVSGKGWQGWGGDPNVSARAGRNVATKSPFWALFGPFSGRNSASLGPIVTVKVGDIFLNTLRNFCATLLVCNPNTFQTQKSSHAQVRAFPALKVKLEIQGFCGRCAAAKPPQNPPTQPPKPPRNPPTQPPKPEGMRGWGPLAGVKRASAFALPAVTRLKLHLLLVGNRAQ